MKESTKNGTESSKNAVECTKVSIEEDCCGICRFCCGAGNGVGECHRNAPTRGNTATGMWPILLSGDWCGEFEKEVL